MIKRICESVVSLRMLQRRERSNILKMWPSRSMLYKVGGRNTVLNDALSGKIPHVTDRPTLILGADVTHPQPGEDSSPSIAAVVASMDWPSITKYRGIVSAQRHHEEMIQDLYKSYQDPVRGNVH